LPHVRQVRSGGSTVDTIASNYMCESRN
jgi:hypothetical protein